MCVPLYYFQITLYSIILILELRQRESERESAGLRVGVCKVCGRVCALPVPATGNPERARLSKHIHVRMRIH